MIEIDIKLSSDTTVCNRLVKFSGRMRNISHDDASIILETYCRCIELNIPMSYDFMGLIPGVTGVHDLINERLGNSGVTKTPDEGILFYVRSIMNSIHEKIRNHAVAYRMGEDQFAIPSIHSLVCNHGSELLKSILTHIVNHYKCLKVDFNEM